MIRHFSFPTRVVLLALLLLVVLVYLPSAALTRATLNHTPAADESLAPTDLVPLPGGCGGVLPPGEAEPVCCMSGYVYLDGQPVNGAKLTIVGPGGSLMAWTEIAPDNPQPYYRVSLSDPPLQAQVGATITVTAEYSEYTRTITHTVLGGGQQIDVVLTRTPTAQYRLTRQSWAEAQSAQFNRPFDVAVDEQGTVYVLDPGNNRVEVFNRSGQFLRQWGTLGSGPGQFASPTGITVDLRGHVFVADWGNRRIQEFSATGASLASWDVAGNAGDTYPVSLEGIAVDPTGNIYVADPTNDHVFKFRSDGSQVGIWGSTGSANGQFRAPYGVAVDSSGNVYVADAGNNRIQKFQGNGVWLASWGSAGNSNGQLSAPIDIAVDGNGNIYVTDSGNYRIQKFQSDGVWLASWGTRGSGDGQFSSIFGIAVDNTATIYVADRDNLRIAVRSNTDGVWRYWGSQGKTGPGQIASIWGLNFDTHGQLYVVDPDNSRIQVYDQNSTYLRQWGKPGTAPGEFNVPIAIAVSTDDRVYVADRNNHRIQVFTISGQFVTSWGGSGAGDGQFIFPWSVALDAAGNVYIIDHGNHRIQVFDRDGKFQRKWGSLGNGNGQFNHPRSIAIDSAGNVYVADTGNSRIQKFRSDGTWLATWDGQGLGSGQFLYATSHVAVDSSGNIYATDDWNRQIDKISSSGVLLARWGSPGGASGSFSGVSAIAVNNDGSVYVAESFGRLQVFNLAPATSPPIATIVKATPVSVPQGQPVALYGMGSDSDATPEIAAYEWAIDGDTIRIPATANTTLNTSNLSLGRHTITLRVRDTENEWSAPVSVRFDVIDPIPSQVETWTFLLYLDADTNAGGVGGSLAPFLDRDSRFGALYRLEHATHNPYVNVVALYDGPGDHDTVRYQLPANGPLVAEAQSEANMGNPQTLIDFVLWGQEHYPATHYYLSIADHANALDGISWDYTSALDGSERLTNAELRQSLLVISDGGHHPIDILHLDGCLMGLIENAYQVRGTVRYLIASQNLAWSAFTYDRYLQLPEARTSARAFATAITDEYARIVGTAGRPYTIAALDIDRVDEVAGATDKLAVALQGIALASTTNREALAALRAQAQALDSDGSITITDRDEYIDLDHWAQLIEHGASDPAIQMAASELRVALQSLIVRNHPASGRYRGIDIDLSNARGIGIYYPQRPSARTYYAYLHGGLSFTSDTHWDEFLAAVLDTRAVDPAPPDPVPVPPLPTTTTIYLSVIQR